MIGCRHLRDELLRLGGNAGRPRCRDFRRQNRRKSSRCHRTSVRTHDRQELTPIDESRGGRVRCATQRQSVSVGPGARCNTRAACGERGSRPPVAFGTGASAVAGATGQRGERAPFEPCGDDTVCNQFPSDCLLVNGRRREFLWTTTWAWRPAGVSKRITGSATGVGRTRGTDAFSCV